MRATIYTIERPLPSSWSMLISVWSLGSPILRNLSAFCIFFVCVLYDWNTVWKKKVETFEKSFWLSTVRNIFLFQLVVSGSHIVANQLKKFWDGLTYQHSCGSKFEPLKLLDMGLWNAGRINTSWFWVWSLGFGTVTRQPNINNYIHGQCGSN